MNKKFLSAILFGALMVTATGTFVSCKDYDDDIDRIDTELGDLKSQVAALQTKVNEGKWITSLTSTAGGFTVAFNDGSSYTIINGKDGDKGETGAAGQNGKDGTTVEVKDGYWYVGGEKTDYVAVTKDELGKIKVPYVGEDGSWYFYNEAGEAVKSNFKAVGATYAVNANGVYTLYVPDANGEMQTVKLPTAGSTLSDIELMGWASLAKLDQNVSETNDIKTNLNVNYKWIEKIIKVYDNNKETTWSAQKTVTKGQVLTTLSPDNANLMARIVAGADAADMSFTLKNSKGAELPISLGTATQYTGLLSRSASGLYAIALDNTADTYANATKYREKFTSGLYALVEKSGFTSNYELEVTAVDATVTTGSVEKVDDKSINTDEAYEVDLNKANAISFTNSKNVYDYYVEAVDPTIAGLFGFSPDKANGTFTVTKLADQITTASFDVYVYKLHIDGKIYRETITIKPVRSLGQEVVYNLGEQTIKSTMTLSVDLADMFTALGNDAAIWKNSTLGARSLSIITKDKDGVDVTTALGTVNVLKTASATTANVYQAVKMELKPNTVSGRVGTMTPGVEYTSTVTFKDADGKALNEIKVKFTPVMPKLSSYITKRDAVWNGNTLMAYFDDPTAAQVAANVILASTYKMANGFTKLGSTNAADKTAITFNLDTDQKISDKKVVADGMASMSANIIELFSTTIGSTTKFHAYAQELNVKVAATYLDGAYTFSDEELKAAGFKVKVQSALEAGKIVPASGASITLPAAAAGEIAKLTPDMITGYTYNDQAYSLFKNATSATSIAYKYTYIKSVEFASTDDVIYTVEGVQDATWSSNKEVAGYAKIKSGNISQTTTTAIKVKVTDMYGYEKTAEIPLTITVGE